MRIGSCARGRYSYGPARARSTRYSSLFCWAAAYIGARIVDDLDADPAVVPSSDRSPSDPVGRGSIRLTVDIALAKSSGATVRTRIASFAGTVMTSSASPRRHAVRI